MCPILLLVISMRLKHKIDRYVNIVNVVLFTKTSMVCAVFNKQSADLIRLLKLNYDFTLTILCPIESLCFYAICHGTNYMSVSLPRPRVRTGLKPRHIPSQCQKHCFNLVQWTKVNLVFHDK